jgi:hypothetical protein
MQTYETVKNGAKAMKNYKVINTETQESQIVTAYTEQQAAEKSGWFIGWCQVRELTLFNGVDK